MKVDIGSIRDVRGGSISFNGNQAVDTSGLELDVEINQPVAINGAVTNTGDGFLVQGEIIYTYRTNCDRCLEPVTGSVNTEITEQFVVFTPFSDADDSVHGLQGDEIDLTDCIREQVFLSLPMKFTCNEACRGLCPQCGQNLNMKDCNCRKEEFNPQFSKLKSLLNQEGGGTDGKS
ncbi:MAG: DUF177 domain-containing protein [Firmicutes bacterium]|nr:DUF177 domain-containing protein [Bacillota bacterium]